MRTDYNSGALGLLAAILADSPDLSGANCIGSPELFDPRDPRESADEVRYRHDAAEALCHQCPALERCRSWTSSRRDDGSVVAAQAPRLPGRPRSGAA